MNSLSTTSANEVDVGDEDGNPGEETEHSDEIDEVAKDGVGSCVNTQESEETECSTESKGINGNATSIGAFEDLESFSLGGKTI